MHDCMGFLQDVKVVTVAMTAYLVEQFPGENTTQSQFCNSCYKVCKTFRLCTEVTVTHIYR